MLIFGRNLDPNPLVLKSHIRKFINNKVYDGLVLFFCFFLPYTMYEKALCTCQRPQKGFKPKTCIVHQQARKVQEASLNHLGYEP